MRRTGTLAAVARRSYWREDDARRIVEAWQDSGEPISRFARSLGVDWRRISRWATRLGGSEEARLRFHPVRVTDEQAPHPRAPYIDIEMGQGRRVRVAAGFATDDLRRVLAILDESRPC
jgi:hypothetical protein